MAIKPNVFSLGRWTAVLPAMLLVILTGVARADDAVEIRLARPASELNLPPLVKASVERRAIARFGIGLHHVPTADLLTSAFLDVDDPDVAFSTGFRDAMAELGLPTRLSPAGFAFWRSQPEHAVFKKINDLEIAVRASNLAHTNHLHYVLDAVHALKDPRFRWAGQKTTVALRQLRAGVEDALGHVTEEFAVPKVDAAAPPPPVRTCAAIFAGLTEDQILDEAARILFERTRGKRGAELAPGNPRGD